MKSLNFTRNIFSILVLAFTFLIVGSVEGQGNLFNPIFFEDFGSLINNTTLSTSNTAFSYLRVGTSTSGSSYANKIVAVSPNNVSGGSGSSAIISAKGGSITTIDKTGLASFSSGTLVFKFNTPSSLTSSILLSAIGTGSSFGSANGFTGSQLSAGFQVNGTSLQVRSASNWTTVQTIYPSTSYTICIVFNNTANSFTYGNGNNLPSNKVDLWVNGNFVCQSSSATSGLSASAFRIYTTTGEFEIDDIAVYNTLPGCNTGTWIGSSTGNWNTASNWCGGVPASGSNLTIPAGTTVTLDGTNEVTVGDLTINATGSLILPSNAKLTVTGNLVNNGTMTIESGSTFVQATNSSTISGTGTYIVKQALPTNRYWYLGVPIGAYTETSFLSNLTNGETLKKRDEAGNQWVTVTSNSTPIPAGRGYYIQNPSSTPTVTFQGAGAGSAFNNGVITTENLTSAGSGFQGFNLVSNPYPSYIDWTTVTKTNVGATMWYRTHDGSSMNFGTVNGSGVGTTIGATTVTKYIPPMQSFWVRVSNFGQAASLTFNNTDRSHFIAENNSVAGLKSSNDNDFVFIRMNLKQAEKMDQLIVYTEDQATNGLDHLDADKMMQANYPQFYTSVGGKKIVINALNASKKQQALPVTIELPTTGVHSFVIEDLEISNGLVWLEDKQEEIIQALEPGTVYEFYANSGINSERFVLHFQLIDDAVPTNVYNEVNSSANFSGKGANVYAESAGVVVIKLPASAEGVTDIQIRDAAGKLVYAGSMNNLETSVELAQANGIYYVTLSSNTGVEVRKVFIQQ